jgi:hypothetical protein
MRRETAWLASILAALAACKSNASAIGAAAVTKPSVGGVSPMRLSDDAGITRIVAPLDRLPATTTKLRDLFIQFTAEKDTKSKQLFTSAYLGSHFCFQEVPEPTAALLSPSQVRSTLSPQRLALLRAVLQCGAALQQSLLAPYVTVVRFTVLGSPVDVRFVQLNLSDLPHEFGFVPQAIEGLSGYCQSEAAGGCRFQSVHLGSMWIFGRSSAIDVMARALKAEGAHGNDRVAATIQAGLESLDPLTQRHVSLMDKTPGQVLRSALSAIEGTIRMGEREAAAMTETLPPEIEKALDAILPHGIAAGEALDPPGTGRVNGSFILIADSDDVARTLQTSIAPVLERWKTALSGSASTPLVRAIRNIVPSRVGRVLRLGIQEALTPGETSQAIAQERSLDERKASVAKILEAVFAGVAIPPDEIARLSGGSPAGALGDKP